MTATIRPPPDAFIALNAGWNTRIDAAEVHVDDVVEVLDRHLVERLVAEDGGVGDHRIEATPFVHRLLGEAGGAFDGGDRLGVGHRLATGRPDLADHLLGQAGIAAAAEGMTAQVVHHHPRAPAGELECVATAHPATGSGHDDDVAVEASACSSTAHYPGVALSAIVLPW